MKKLLMLVIVLILSCSIAISNDTKKDSILVSIDDIKVCNIVFSDYDRVIEENIIYSKITNISNIIINTEDDVISNLQLEVSNLRKIINTKDEVTELKLLEEERKTKKARNRANITTGVGIVLLILLL